MLKYKNIILVNLMKMMKILLPTLEKTKKMVWYLLSNTALKLLISCQYLQMGSNWPIRKWKKWYLAMKMPIDLTRSSNVENILSNKKTTIGIETKDLSHLMRNHSLKLSAKVVNFIASQKNPVTFRQRKMKRQLKCTWKIFLQGQTKSNRLSKRDWHFGFVEIHSNIKNLLVLKLKKWLTLCFSCLRMTILLAFTKDLIT